MSKLNADMSTPTDLRSAVRGALCAARATFTLLKASKLSARIGLIALMSLQAVACADVTAPGRRMDRDAVEALMPAISDARRRVASGIADVSVRQQLTINLSAVEIALRGDDVAAAQKAVAAVQTLLNTYSPRAYADRQEISAVFLVLAGVERVATPDASTVFSIE
jgi:hypothetical protein